MGRLRGALALAFAVVLATLTAAEAKPEGIFDATKSGCNCHGGVVPPPNTTTRPIIMDLPEAYVPGQSYPITLWVIGITAPTGTAARAGFNLKVSHGSLVNVDDRTRLQTRNECEMMEIVACEEADRGTPACVPPGVTVQEPPLPCSGQVDCYTRRCEIGTEDCRPCSEDAIVDIQATHTLAGNDNITWSLIWTAPDPGVGSVRFFMAGNFVNGDGAGSHDPLDVWAVADPVIVPQAK